MPAALDSLFLDPADDGTLQSRIRRMLSQAILSGRFRPGERLPSSRQLARHLGVSRITVTLAYTELVSDDYVTARGRSGYFVSDNAPEAPRFAPLAPRRNGVGTVDWTRAIARGFGPPFGVDKPGDWASYRYPFIYGQTDPTLFDGANWRLCALQALGRRDFAALTSDQYDRDDPKLVEFIARVSLPRRGIQAAPDEILVTLGAQNALWLAAQLLLTPDRHAAIEDPGYPALRALLAQNGARISPVAVDAEGLPPEAVPGGIDVLFTTPGHQCPTTATLPLDRRRALLARAEAENFLIVEDDYDFEMSFLKPPSPSLKSLDRDGRVIYVGSFSKSLFPGLRLGYLVGPAPFIAEARNLRGAVLRHPPGLIQRTVAYFLSLGHYDALIRRVGRAYHERRRVIDAAIATAGLQVAGAPAFGGSAIWMRAPEGIETGALAARLQTRGVLIEPGAPFFATPGAGGDTYRLAYSSIPASRIPDGVALIAEALAVGREKP
ncbi:MAG: aminotransferase class I/II-fold pyridoxal phosphate-dependent enzyme [Limimaricola sp.]|uniref:MocR-like pyridoxine biosynthesis transcription factor PdxR n=1 Tax=Limimaricola sp. TaxID=2211665 RepID=UPI001D91095B|nr:PLP-dependent aminotransferase family protein [Limimaricola sp.]MBI1417555.1 aminotransferase class I/II-fold pyridoxal phosphate-dependent enzyme [Limimaricola sp.]